MSEKKCLLKTTIPRKDGFLYYLKGNPLELYEVPMNKTGRKPKKK